MCTAWAVELDTTFKESREMFVKVCLFILFQTTHLELLQTSQAISVIAALGKVEGKGLVVQGHLWLHSELEASLCCMRTHSSLKNKLNKNKQKTNLMKAPLYIILRHRIRLLCILKNRGVVESGTLREEEEIEQKCRTIETEEDRQT